jgi:RHS repeat-associated protein
VLLTSTQVDDDWSGGYVGLFRGNQGANIHQFDDFNVGYDNNADEDFDDGGDVLAVSDSFGDNVTNGAISLSYDANGNLTGDGIFAYAYDAWNRLRLAKLVVDDGQTVHETTIGDYEYYGDTRRSRKTVTNHGPEVYLNDGGDRQTRFYYAGWRPDSDAMSRWSIAETRNGSSQAVQHMLWGTQYIDELVMFENNGDPGESDDTDPDEQTCESTDDERYIAHQDRNWNVVALSDYDPNATSAGAPAERYAYDPYGTFIGIADSGAILPASMSGNVFTHQGLTHDSERGAYQNRNREYTPHPGRFPQRDPLAETIVSYATSDLGWGNRYAY